MQEIAKLQDKRPAADADAGGEEGSRGTLRPRLNRTPSTELVGSRTRILPPDQILAFFTFAVVGRHAWAEQCSRRGRRCARRTVARAALPRGVVVGMALLMGVAVLGLGSLSPSTHGGPRR